ncbi:MAG: LysM peptidoglycan-binding domain-containing protein [Austwickia sp.]|jgi:LysM repeat protein|nr:LysM peptidoglycan-binding domain-containing protein [Austwickia sp.]MBK8435577.1 LysM peptidoglycan-binding domain-containing protein [Austwickia sp.]MBK9100853.1 LysM peptidoglycan-binding domain-containing protein [Austwickia sp.]
MSPAAVPPALPATAHVQPAFAEFAGWAHGSPRRTPYGWSTYIVRRGDTLSELAARHHTTVAQLVAKNRMRSAGTVLRAGERLAVPRLRPAPSLRRTVSAGRVDARYAVRPGDTLGGIAARHGLSARQLAAANQISTHAVLRIGQRLTVPGGQSATRSTVKASRSSAAGSFGASYTVKAGDTLSGIAARYGVSQTALLKANHLRSTVIRTGQRLAVPGALQTSSGTSLGATPRANLAYLRSRPAPSRTKVRSMIVEASRRHGVDPRLALAIGWQESGWNQRQVSYKNAIGVMQCLPSTGRWMSGVVGRKLDLMEARDNITCGVALLRTLGRAADDEREVIAAYYQGLASVRSRGLYDDTVRYVNNVLAHKRRM